MHKDLNSLKENHDIFCKIIFNNQAFCFNVNPSVNNKSKSYINTFKIFNSIKNIQHRKEKTALCLSKVIRQLEYIFFSNLYELEIPSRVETWYSLPDAH